MGATAVSLLQPWERVLLTIAAILAAFYAGVLLWLYFGGWLS